MLLALVGCGEAADTVKEATEIASEGGSKQLRDTLRAPGGPPRVLIFALDGVGHEALHEALDRGALPALAAVLGDPTGSGAYTHGVSAGPVLSVLPSITLAAWTTLFTGAPPAETGVPGNEWFERGRNRFHAPAPVSVTGRGDAMAALADQLLDSLVAVPTLFERAGVRSYVSLLPLHRGADMLGLPDGGALADLFAAFPKGAVGDDPVEREVYASGPDVGGSHGDHGPGPGSPRPGRGLLPGHRPLHPRGAVSSRGAAALPGGGDGPGHGGGAGRVPGGRCPGRDVRAAIADHGHTPVPRDAVHALGGDSAFSAGAALESAGFRVRPPSLKTDSDDHQAVMAWQGAFAYISLADRSTCAAAGSACAWPRPPRWDHDVVPAARALARAAAAHPSRPLDLVLLRKGAGGEGTASEILVLDDAEPAPLDRYLRASPRPELLAFAERLGWLTNGPHGDHAGDIILMTRLGASIPQSERYYFSNPYHSWHASAEAQDSHTPLVLARADLSGDEVRQRMGTGWKAESTQLDFVSLVLRLLEAP